MICTVAPKFFEYCHNKQILDKFKKKKKTANLYQAFLLAGDKYT